MFSLGSVSSKITLEVVGVNRRVKETFTFSNIMTNFGLDSWTKGILGTHIALGSGSRTELPTVTDLAVFVRTASGTYSYSNTNIVDEVNGVMRSDLELNLVFPIETSSQNYSEMGIHNNNSNELQTYARIRDAVGNPTSIAVLAGEQVRVKYVVQFRTPLSYTSTQTIGGQSTTVTAIPLATGASNNIRLPNPDLNATRFWTTGQPIPQAGVAPTGGVAPPRASTINNGQYVMTYTQNEMNIDGISLIRMGGTANNVGLMYHFNPPINKTAATGLSVVVTSTLNNGDFYES